MNTLETVLVVLQALCSVVVILVVMLQSGKEAGLSGAIGGGSETYLGKGKGKNLDQVLASATKWVALAWIVLTLLLSLI